jgi:hypothetical protein
LVADRQAVAGGLQLVAAVMYRLMNAFRFSFRYKYRSYQFFSGSGGNVSPNALMPLLFTDTSIGATSVFLVAAVMYRPLHFPFFPPIHYRSYQFFPSIHYRYYQSTPKSLPTFQTLASFFLWFIYIPKNKNTCKYTQKQTESVPLAHEYSTIAWYLQLTIT